VLKSPMAGLMRRIAVRQVGPGSAGPEDPEDAIEYRAMLPPGASSTVWPARQRWQEGPNEGPLLIREVTGMTGSGGHPDRMAATRRGFSQHNGVTGVKPGADSCNAAGRSYFFGLTSRM
jgi:hypothetical protein